MFDNVDLNTFWESAKNLPGFKSDAFEELYRDTDGETVLKILAHFHENLNQCYENIANAITRGDSEPIWKVSHKAAGSAELLGFKEFGHLARELSVRIKANPDIQSYNDEIHDFFK